MIETHTCSRREAIAGTLALAAGVGVLPIPSDAASGNLDTGDFAFLMGNWHVRHHKLKGRLVGSTDWADFEGAAHAWPLLGSVANVDDNVLHDPSGMYRGISLRRYDASRRQWSIWRMDDRSSALFPPVVGAFDHAVGTFWAMTSCAASRFSCDLSGPISLRAVRVGNRPFHLTAAPRGK
jgi:hypothetical protein